MARQYTTSGHTSELELSTPSGNEDPAPLELLLKYRGSHAPIWVHGVTPGMGLPEEIRIATDQRCHYEHRVVADLRLPGPQPVGSPTDPQFDPLNDHLRWEVDRDR